MTSETTPSKKSDPQAPGKGVAWRTAAISGLLGVIASGLFFYFWSSARRARAPHAAASHDMSAMGDAALPAGAAEAAGSRKIRYYRAPMDPKQTSPVPRKDEMGMDYIPVYQDEIAAGGTLVDGLAAVTIDPSRQQLIGLRTAQVQRETIGSSLRTVGRVQVDPTRVRKTNLKIDGYVEKIFVDFVGKAVRKGDPLFSIYSPELLSAQSEYLLALQTRKALATGGGFSIDGDVLVTSARRKLQLWDVPDPEIDHLERTGVPTKELTFFSPISGVVTAKNIVEGTRVAAGDAPYEITDLSMVWIMADVYEAELRKIQVGMKATFAAESFPGHLFEGDVVFIDPLLDAKTRTAKVHLHFPNPHGDLKPEMFGEVVLQAGAHVGLTAPSDAVIHTGTKDVVFIDLGEGKFQPREVEVGGKTGDRVEIVKGLDEGARVVVRANFLVDSESRLRAALSAMGEK